MTAPTYYFGRFFASFAMRAAIVFSLCRNTATGWILTLFYIAHIRNLLEVGC